MNFRKYKPFDRTKVVQLLNFSLERSACSLITERSFEWKHFDSIFESQTIAFVAQYNDRIVSFVCFTPLKLNNENLIWNCSIQATDPEFRRQGIVTKLTKLCEKEIELISNKVQNSYIGFCNESGLQIDRNSKEIQHQIIGQLNQLIIFPSFFLFEGGLFDNQKVKLLTLSKSKSYLQWKYENNPKIKYQKITNEDCIIFYIESFLKIEICDIIPKAHYQLDLVSAINFTKKKFPTKIITITYLPNSATDFISNQKTIFSINSKIPTWFTVRSKNNELLSNHNWLVFGGDIL